MSHLFLKTVLLKPFGHIFPNFSSLLDKWRTGNIQEIKFVWWSPSQCLSTFEVPRADTKSSRENSKKVFLNKKNKLNIRKDEHNLKTASIGKKIPNIYNYALISFFVNRLKNVVRIDFSYYQMLFFYRISFSKPSI